MSETLKKEERHVGFELLRIVSMVMIVFMHVIGHGGLGYSVPSNTLAYHIYWLIYAFSRVSTNCFVMLTGYYMVKSRIRFSRVFRIWCEVLFYSVLTYAIAVKVGAVEIAFSEIVKVFTPISSEEYWFATGYIFLYLSIPLLNRVISGIKSKNEFQKILLGILTVTSILPTLLYWADPLFVNGGYSFIWFVVLYFIAAYIRIYDIKADNKIFVLIYVGLAVMAPFMRIAAEVIQLKIGATTFVDNVMDYKMPITVIMSVAFFMIFKNLEIKNKTAKKVITKIAPMSFGVYLLHDSGYIRRILWDAVNISRFGNVAASLLYMLAVAGVIVSVGYAVSFIYQALYRLLPSGKIEKRIDAIMKTERTKNDK